MHKQPKQSTRRSRARRRAIVVALIVAANPLWADKPIQPLAPASTPLPLEISTPTPVIRYNPFCQTGEPKVQSSPNHTSRPGNVQAPVSYPAVPDVAQGQANRNPFVPLVNQDSAPLEIAPQSESQPSPPTALTQQSIPNEVPSQFATPAAQKNPVESAPQFPIEIPIALSSTAPDADMAASPEQRVASESGPEQFSLTDIPSIRLLPPTLIQPEPDATAVRSDQQAPNQTDGPISVAQAQELRPFHPEDDRIPESRLIQPVVAPLQPSVEENDATVKLAGKLLPVPKSEISSPVEFHLESSGPWPEVSASADQTPSALQPLAPASQPISVLRSVPKLNEFEAAESPSVAGSIVPLIAVPRVAEPLDFSEPVSLDTEAEPIESFTDPSGTQLNSESQLSIESQFNSEPQFNSESQTHGPLQSDPDPKRNLSSKADLPLHSGSTVMVVAPLMLEDSPSQSDELADEDDMSLVVASNEQPTTANEQPTTADEASTTQPAEPRISMSAPIRVAVEPNLVDSDVDSSSELPTAATPESETDETPADPVSPVAVSAPPLQIERPSEQEHVAIVRPSAQPTVAAENQAPSQPARTNKVKPTPLHMDQAQVRSLVLGGRVHRVEISDQSICQVVASRPNTLKLIGTRTGVTQMIVWATVGEETKPRVRVFAVYVKDPLGSYATETVSASDPVADQQRGANTKVTVLQRSVAAMYPQCQVMIHQNQRGLVVNGYCDSERSAVQIIRLIRKACLVPVEDNLKVR